MVIGGDLNFTISLQEVWGSSLEEDCQKGLFFSFLENSQLIDVELAKLSPTWRNFRIGDEEAAKILERFQFYESLMD